MFYKYDINADEWCVGLEIHAPNGDVYSAANKTSFDGWVWHDSPPVEYTEWLDGQMN